MSYNVSVPSTSKFKNNIKVVLKFITLQGDPNQNLNNYLLQQFHNNSQRIAQQEIDNHERLSQPFRKMNMTNAFINAGTGATGGAIGGAIAGAAGGPLGAGLGAAGGAAGGALTGFTTTVLTDAFSSGTKEGTMQPPNYENWPRQY